MSDKLIKNMDEEVWRRFVAFCKLKDIKVNDQLKNILEEFVDKNLQKMILNKKGGSR